jgi:hypothetical protein
MQGAQKTSDEKRGIAFHEQEMHPSKCKGLERPPMKKKALHFRNKKCTPQNVRGSKDLH